VFCIITHNLSIFYNKLQKTTLENNNN